MMMAGKDKVTAKAVMPPMAGPKYLLAKPTNKPAINTMTINASIFLKPPAYASVISGGFMYPSAVWLKQLKQYLNTVPKRTK